MRQNILHIGVSLLLYWLITLLANSLLVLPPNRLHLCSFLPPLLGLMYGPAAALGVGMGELLLHGEELSNAVSALFSGTPPGLALGSVPLLSRDFLCALLSASLPFFLWHRVLSSSFALRIRTLMNFIGVIFLMTMAKAAIIALTTSKASAVQILLAGKSSSTEFFDYIFFRTTTDFNLALFFSFPIFFFLVSRGFPFFMPGSGCARKESAAPEEHPLLMLVFYPFLLVLFLLMDLSGAIYGMDRLDVWQMFNLEILTAMNFSMAILACIFLKFRHSITNNIIMLELLTVLLAAFALGGICYVSMNRLTEDRIAETMDTVSAMSRGRLSGALDGIRTSAQSMRDLALRKLKSYDRFASSPEYQEEYLREMEELLYPIAYHTDGCISYYLRCVVELTGPKAGFYCVRPAGHWEGIQTPFHSRYATDISQYAEKDLGWYYLPLRRHNPTWTAPYVDVNTNARVMSYSMPLYAEGKPLGVIGMDVDFEYLIHEIRRMAVYEHGFAYLTDRNGHVLYHKDYRAGTLVPEDPDIYTRETYLSSGIWLGIAVPAYEIYKDRNAMLIHLVLCMLILVMVLSTLSIYLALRGIRPLMALMEVVKKMAAGNLNVTVAYKSRNELGALASGINEMAAKLDAYIHHDGLTGLRNTAAYRRSVETLKKRSQKEHIPYALVIFDANFLKQTNDRYGHEAGNELICRIASRISAIFAHSPAFRVGGDEFIVILEGDDYEDRERLLAKFDEAIAHTTLQFEGHEIAVSVARGLAVHQAGQSYEELFQQADAAMYQNKADVKAKKKWRETWSKQQET